MKKIYKHAKELAKAAQQLSDTLSLAAIHNLIQKCNKYTDLLKQEISDLYDFPDEGLSLDPITARLISGVRETRTGSIVHCIGDEICVGWKISESIAIYKDDQYGDLYDVLYFRTNVPGQWVCAMAWKR